MIKKFTFFALSCLFVHVATFAHDRVKININTDWQYLEMPYASIADFSTNDPWQSINLPHSWNAEDATDILPGYRRSVSWYKKSLDLKPDQSKRYILYFEGVNTNSSVFVNGQHAGGHVGGYLGFEVEITDLLTEGSNTIHVKVDNGNNPQIIPSQQSDFFIYGGITRDVWLKTVPKTYLTNIKISTPEVSASRATSQIDVQVEGVIDASQKLQINVFDPSGAKVFSHSAKLQSNNSIKFKLKNPALWDIVDPNLYSVEAQLISNGEPIDELTDRYGMRWFEFKDHGPFYLNGKRVLLRGTHRHEEHAGVGPAMSNAQHRQDIEQIKGMGANFIRLAHYPQDPEVYAACDELGILVWDELPWCRGGVGDAVWKKNTTNMLTEIIDQNYNHPSIILWSLGNEIYWLPDFEGGDNRDSINLYLTELNTLAHQMDPSRKTAIRKYYEGADIVDVFSPSIWSGWYSGTYKNYEKVVQQSIDKYNHFVHMEYGGSSHVGRHTENPITGEGVVNSDKFEEEVNQIEVISVAKSGDWSENYIVDLFDWYLKTSESNDQFVGNAQWAFKDFGTPLRPENDIPYMNQKGLVDRAGNPKDAYYVFKSYWSTDPFSYIESHTWTERSGPEGEARNVCVYSNNEVVELFHNGKSLGKKTRDMNQFPACGLNWNIDFASGQNDLIAVGYVNNKQASTDSLSIAYRYEQAGTPDELKLSYAPLTDGTFLVTVTALDKNGLRCLDYEERVYFQCLRGGELLRNQGTPTGSESIKMANGQASIVVIPNKNQKEIEVTVLNQYFKGSFLSFESK